MRAENTHAPKIPGSCQISKEKIFKEKKELGKKMDQKSLRNYLYLLIEGKEEERKKARQRIKITTRRIKHNEAVFPNVFHMKVHK